MFHRVILSALVFLPTICWANFVDLTVGAGLIDQYVGQVQVNRGGSTNSFDYSPFLTIGGEFEINGPINLYPELGIIIPGGERDPLITKYTYWTNIVAGYQWDEIIFLAGMGFSFNYISSDGGTQTLNNGTSSTQFYMPENTSTSRNLVTLLGMEFIPSPEWSARIEGQVFNIEDSLSRAFNYTLSVHYHFQDSLWN